MEFLFTNWQQNILSLFLFSTLFGLLVPLGLAFTLQRSRFLELTCVLLSLSIIGSMAGLTGGLSQEPVVGAIIPAFLGLLGSIAVYLFGMDRSKGVLASFGAAALALSLLIGFLKGAEKRNFTFEKTMIREICVEAYMNPELTSNETARLIFQEKIGKNYCTENVVSWRLENAKTN